MSPPTERIAEYEAIGRSLAGSTNAAAGAVDRNLIRNLGGAGLLDLIFSEGGVTAVDLCAVRQGLARVNTAAETALALQGLGGFPIHLFGTGETRSRWIPEITSGNAVAAFALTEPGAGSDAAALALAATPDGDGYRLNGEKAFISNAPEADIYSLFARTGPDEGSRGVTAFAIPGETPGVSGEAIEMISPHPIGRIRLDDVYVPASAVIGEVNQGFRVAMKTLDLFRPSVGAFALGMAEAALREAVAHAVEREAFGQKIQSFQGITHQLADVRMEIEAAGHMVYSAAHALDAGGGDSQTGRSAMAKLFATETAQHAVDVAIQVLGARGLEASSLLAHLYLEVRAPRIYEGTSEIQRNIIAREMFSGRI